MAGKEPRSIGLADAIGMLRDEVLKARMAAAGSDVQFPVSSMTLELQVVATHTAEGKAGFCVPVINLEIGGSGGWEREATQTVTVVFEPPVDQQGNPVKVARLSDELTG
jgi:hypothetical protein